MFYEQYLTIWPDTLESIGYSLLGVFAVSTVVSGFDLFASAVILINTVMIVVNIGGLMYIWGISLNAVSLVNLVMVS